MFLDVCGPAFEEELKFWSIDPNEVEVSNLRTIKTYLQFLALLLVNSQFDNK
jgi:hypothetical protein